MRASQAAPLILLRKLLIYMSLSRLKSANFRNLIDLSLEPAEQFNLIYGQNGSGKSSILEAIYFLSLGRSFRSHLASRIINYEQSKLSIFGLVNQPSGAQISLGIEKTRSGKIRTKVANETATSVAELAKILPLQLINPDSYQLLSAGPRQRRQFLDWGVFHVEQSFFPLWQRFQRILKQRNSALQQQSVPDQIKIWDIEFIETAKELSQLRERYVDQLKPVVMELLQDLIELNDLSITYYPGWNVERGLEDILNSCLNRDLMLGYTQFGPQRADVLIKINNIPAEDVLSRGEQKLLVCALQLAQGLLLWKLADKRCIYLLDDIAAELDNNRRQKIMDVLKTLQAQVFVTAVDKDIFSDLIQQVPHKLFHVKQGSVELG